MVDQDKIFELISAIQKAIRRCEVNDARYFASELIDMDLPHTVWGQLRIIAAEDIGLADPTMVGYVEEHFDHYNKLIKDKYKIKEKDVKQVNELCDIIDRVVIAEATSYKSRLLPMATFITLYNIFKNEKFREVRYKYFDNFVNALDGNDIGKALYYSFVVDKFFGDRKPLLRKIKDRGKNRNGNLIKEWIEAYIRKENLLTLSGSIMLLCRDYNITNGEYKDAIDQHLNIPIKAAKIPDHAYDMHTKKGRIKGRDLKYFFNVSAKVENQRFDNYLEEGGKKAYFEADKLGLADEKNLIKAIKKKQTAPPNLMTI